MGPSLPFLPSKIQLNKICNSSQEVFISLAAVFQSSSSLGRSWACLGVKVRAGTQLAHCRMKPLLQKAGHKQYQYNKNQLQLEK